jgi:hypothetical protein
MDTRVKFLSGGDAVDYDFDKHGQLASKFIYSGFDDTGGQILIIGDKTFSHQKLFKDAQYLGLLPQDFPEDSIDGAGTCLNGKITDWESPHFGETMEEFRGGIKKLLKM